MMPAMMLPSAVPFLVGYARHSSGEGHVVGMAILVTVYALLWTVLGAAAWLVFPMLPTPTVAIAGAVVAAAIAYGFTPLQRACRERCQAMSHERRSPIRLALEYGINCVGCSAGVMAALFAVGPMNPLWMLLAAGAVIAYKWPRAGTRSGSPSLQTPS